MNEAERRLSGSTCYFEFQNGSYRGRHWLKGSIYIHASKFDEFGLYILFTNCIEAFCYDGLTEVNKEQWDKLRKKAVRNEIWSGVILEITPWVEACFQKHKCFTICGI